MVSSDLEDFLWLSCSSVGCSSGRGDATSRSIFLLELVLVKVLNLLSSLEPRRSSSAATTFLLEDWRVNVENLLSSLVMEVVVEDLWASSSNFLLACRIKVLLIRFPSSSSLGARRVGEVAPDDFLVGGSSFIGLDGELPRRLGDCLVGDWRADLSGTRDGDELEVLRSVSSAGLAWNDSHVSVCQLVTVCSTYLTCGRGFPNRSGGGRRRAQAPQLANLCA